MNPFPVLVISYGELLPKGFWEKTVKKHFLTVALSF